MNKIYNRGYIALTSMLVIMTVILTIFTSVSLWSINDIQASLSDRQGEGALNFVEGCAEDALLHLNEENNIPSIIQIPGGSCSVTINSHSGDSWDFTVSGQLSNYRKNIRVNATRSSSLNVTGWQEQ